MVLFDEDPVTLISETTNQFHIAPDKDSLSRISSSLSALSVNRSSRLDAQHSALKSLSRRLNSLRSQCEYDEGRRDTGRHASEILALDGEKFRVAKAVNEAEVEGERLVSELAGLKRTLEGLEREGVEGGRRAAGVEEDEIVLKLQVYRLLGIDISQDTGTGEFSRAIIRNSEQADVNIVNVDGKLSQRYYVDTFWDSLGS